MSITKEQLKAMSIEERDELLSNLWDVIDEMPSSYTDRGGQESEEELNLLREDMAEYRRDPSSAKTWQEVFEELRNSING